MRRGGMHMKNLALQKSIKRCKGEGITLQNSRLYWVTWMWGANIYKHFFVSLSTKQRAKNLLGKRAGIKAMNMTARLVWEDVLWGCYGRSCVVNKSLLDVGSCGAPVIIQNDRSRSHFSNTLLPCQMIHLQLSYIVCFGCLFVWGFFPWLYEYK